MCDLLRTTHSGLPPRYRRPRSHFSFLTLPDPIHPSSNHFQKAASHRTIWVTLSEGERRLNLPLSELHDWSHSAPEKLPSQSTQSIPTHLPTQACATRRMATERRHISAAGEQQFRGSG